MNSHLKRPPTTKRTTTRPTTRVTTALPDLGGFGGVEEIAESVVDEDYESFEYEDPGNEKDAECKERVSN